MKDKPNKPTAGLIEQIRDIYVQGVIDSTGNRTHISIEQLALNHNVAKVTLFRKAKEQDWKTQRAIFEQKLSNDKDILRRKRLVDESVEFDTRNLTIAKALQNQVSHLINIASTEIQEDRTRRPFNPVGLERLANATLYIQKVGRLALGENTEHTKIDGAINYESTLSEINELIDELTREKSLPANTTH